MYYIMETDIGVPLDYKPKVDFHDKIMSRNKAEDPFATPIENVYPDDDSAYQQQQQQQQQSYPYYQEPIYYQQQQPIMYPPVGKPDLFAQLDKTVYILAFLAFILGYFMGKSVQPVIIRPG